MDISKLTKEEKLQYLDLLAEKKRRIIAKKPVYKPNIGQLPVHKDLRPIRIVAAANGGGKSTLAVQEVIWWATGFNPVTEEFTKVPAQIIVLLDAPSKVEKIWLKEMRKWYPLDDECTLMKHGKPYVTEVQFKNGSAITFMFHEQDDLTFEGIQLHYLCADEPFPRRIWIALTRGAREKRAKPKFLIIGTPLGQPWLYNELWKKAAEGERPDVGIHRFSIDVNEHNLADGYVEQFSRNLTDAEKKVRLQGHFAHLEGLALAHLFDRAVHVVKPFTWPQGKPCVLIIDPAQAKPHTAILIGATGDGRIYYIKEMRSKAPPEEFARQMKDFYQGYRVIDYIIDSLGETPGTGGDGNMSFSEKLRQRGVPVRSTSFKDKSDEDFIARIKQVLEIPDEPDNFMRKQPVLAIIEGNQGIINDIETAQWQKYRQHEVFKEKLEISQKDYLACLKYGLATNISFVAKSGTTPKIKRPRRSPWAGKR